MIDRDYEPYAGDEDLRNDPDYLSWCDMLDRESRAAQDADAAILADELAREPEPSTFQPYSVGDALFGGRRAY